jgi:6-phosphofructokinase
MPSEVSVAAQPDELLHFLHELPLFQSLTEDEIRLFLPLIKRFVCPAGHAVLKEGETGENAFIVETGRLCLERMGKKIKVFSRGEVFGIVALLGLEPRSATVTALEDSALLQLSGADLMDETRIPLKTSVKVYREFCRELTSYLRGGMQLFKEMDVLLVQDGGCAPGYNTVTAFISQFLENSGRQVYVAAEGFKSLGSGKPDDFYRLVNDPRIYESLEHIPGVFFAPPLRDARGARFRTERYRDFVKPELQEKAARLLLERNVKVLVGIGGNGTFAGIRSLGKFLPEEVQLFFVPVTIDSDIYGTECIGEHTGVEIGAEKIHCYLADARTHKRCYLIEMMGAEGGYHALHSCLGAGAHLALVPSSHYDPAKLAQALRDRDYTVIVIAEGYKKEERKAKGYQGNAAEYFRDELMAAGLVTGQKVVCEGFSRDIRGASPNNKDIMLAQQMARKLTELVMEGKSHFMPAVLSGKEYAIPFWEIRTDNSVESTLVGLANRLGV